MNRSWQKIFWVLLIIVNLFCFGYFSELLVSGPDRSLLQKEQSRLIGMSYMTLNNEFYRIVSQEIYSAADAHGDQIILRDPALSITRQMDQIREMIREGIDVLIITPVDWEKIDPVLREARSKGIQIIVVDSDIVDDSIAATTITSDNYMAGKIIGEYFLTRHDSASVVLMTHESARSGQLRIMGFLDAIKDHPEIEVVGSVECEGQSEIAMPALLNFIQDGPEFDSVFCLNDLAALGAVAALDQKGLLDTVSVYGIDASPDSKALIYEGMLQASVAQFPNEIGKAAASALYMILEERKPSSRTLIPVELITAENVHEYEIDRWQ